MTLSVYEYSNYRDFLKAAIEQVRAQDAKLTFRKLAVQLGLKSHSYIGFIIDGKRNMELPTIKKLSRFFSFNESEAHYFRYLVELNQATTPEARVEAMEQLMKNKGYLKAKPLSVDQYSYYSDWMYLAVRESLETSSIQGDKTRISKKFDLPLAKVQQILNSLIEIGLVKLDSTSDRYQKAQEFVQAQAEMNSSFLYKFHAEMIAKAGQALFDVAPQHRDMSAVTLPIKLEDLQAAQTFIEGFRRQFMAKFNSASDGNAVYQLNMQLFPLILLDNEGDK